MTTTNQTLRRVVASMRYHLDMTDDPREAKRLRAAIAAYDAPKPSAAKPSGNDVIVALATAAQAGDGEAQRALRELASPAAPRSSNAKLDAQMGITKFKPGVRLVDGVRLEMGHFPVTGKVA